MCAISTVLVPTASAACGIGTISAAGNTWISKLPSVIALTCSAKVSAAP